SRDESAVHVGLSRSSDYRRRRVRRTACAEAIHAAAAADPRPTGARRMTMHDVRMNASRNLGEDVLAKIGDLVSVAIAVWDDHGLSYANAEFEALTGYQQTELRSMSLLTLLAPEYRDAVREDRDRLASQGGEERCEVLLVGRDGDSRWIEQTLKAHQSDDRTV